MYDAIGGVGDYFYLKTYNNALMEENARFRESIYLANAELDIDTDSTYTPFTSADSTKQFEFIPALVINNNYSKSSNYITIKAGKKDSVSGDMGVITSNGLVGVIDKTSNSYSTVLSVLNGNFTTSAQLKKSSHYGTISWGNRDPNLVTLKDIPSQAQLQVGDTIITSGRSAIFPKGIRIGQIADFQLDTSENYYTIQVRLFNDMTNLGYVYVIKNNDLEEIKTLETLSNEQ